MELVRRRCRRTSIYSSTTHSSGTIYIAEINPLGWGVRGKKEVVRFYGCILTRGVSQSPPYSRADSWQLLLGLGFVQLYNTRIWRQEKANETSGLLLLCYTMEITRFTRERVAQR